MKYVLAAAAALLLVSTPAAAVPVSSASVEVADGDWSYLPPLRDTADSTLITDAATKIHKRAVDARCTIDGLNRRQLDMNLPFAAQFHTDGSLKRLVVKRLNCPQVEGVVASLLLKLIEQEELKATGANEDGWYQGRLSFLSVAW